MPQDLNWLDRFALSVFPKWGASRVRNRAIAAYMKRNYEAASTGRRTVGWRRSSTDANAANLPALAALREHARDLVRNNAWARNGVRVITNGTVGWGILAKPAGEMSDPQRKRLLAAWKEWAESEEIDADGRRNFYGIQSQVMQTVVESGEILIRRRWRRASDGLTVPLQLQVLEPDYLDSSMDGTTGAAGGPIIQGVEFDKLGRRAAYWIFDQHPGSNLPSASYSSRRIPASEILHVYRADRPGQVRGVSWLAAAITALKDFDDYEDATQVRQKVAACLVGVMTDVNGEPAVLGAEQDADADGNPIGEFQPGMFLKAAPGQDVKFSAPPSFQDDGFSNRMLRRIAASIGITYESMTGDFSQTNFSSARMGRLGMHANIEDWRWNMIVPQCCDPVWRWFCEAAAFDGLISGPVPATWAPPPPAMLEPEKEGLAISRLVRNGVKTPSEVVREQGRDPEEFFAEYAEDLKRLDAKGIVLDCDARNTNQSGQAQQSGQGVAPASEEASVAEPEDDAEEPAA